MMFTHHFYCFFGVRESPKVDLAHYFYCFLEFVNLLMSISFLGDAKK